MATNHVPAVYDVYVRKHDVLIRTSFIVKLLKQKPIATNFVGNLI